MCLNYLTLIVLTHILFIVASKEHLIINYVLCLELYVYCLELCNDYVVACCKITLDSYCGSIRGLLNIYRWR